MNRSKLSVACLVRAFPKIPSFLLPHSFASCPCCHWMPWPRHWCRRCAVPIEASSLLSSAGAFSRDRRHLRLDVFDLIDLTNDKVTSGAKIALVDAAIRQGSHAMEAIKRVFTPGVPSSVRQSAILAVQDAAPELTRALLPRVMNDSDHQIRLHAPKLLKSAPDLLSDQLLAVLLNDSEGPVRRAACRLIANASIFPEHALLRLCDQTHPLPIRLAAVSTLVQRGHHFSLGIAHQLSLERDADLRRYGWCILRAIARSREDHIGTVRMWNAQRGFGFIRWC